MKNYVRLLVSERDISRSANNYKHSAILHKLLAKNLPIHSAKSNRQEENLVNR
ncbi:hypothetical protein OAL46_00880 [Akkermansiaceae bacterium]|nr:hypothetical protein [Akkermansiaceae bacterium]MDC0327261.1 hypothetical protein [Akkermansiaceae bacterium]